MRPQQNRRISNPRRNNGGAVRRAPNPLTRNYESSGPEVKIRGNAQHIAEKYLALARDAQAAGDRVMGENYLQHAEHYIRIILSAQSHEQNARPERNEQAEEPREDFTAARPMAAAEADNDSEYDENAPQPVIDGVPGEVALIHRGGYKSSEGEEEQAAQPRRRRLPARRAAPIRRRISAAEEGEESRLEQGARPEYSARAAGAEEAERPGRAERAPRASRMDSAAPAERLNADGGERTGRNGAAESNGAAELRADEDAPRAPRRRAAAAAISAEVEGETAAMSAGEAKDNGATAMSAGSAADNAAGAEGMEAAAKPARIRRPRRTKPAAEAEQPGNL